MSCVCIYIYILKNMESNIEKGKLLRTLRDYIKLNSQTDEISWELLDIYYNKDNFII